MNKSDKLDKIVPALINAQKQIKNVSKDAKNPYFKSNYATLDNCISSTKHILNDNDIFVSQAPTVIDGNSVIETILFHSSGQYLGSNYPVVASKANDPQAQGSAVTYARRYSLLATLFVGTGEDDDAEHAMAREPKKGKPMSNDTFNALSKDYEDCRTTTDVDAITPKILEAKKDNKLNKEQLDLLRDIRSALLSRL